MNINSVLNTILLGDCLTSLMALPDGMINTCVTSHGSWNYGTRITKIKPELYRLRVGSGLY